MILGTVVNSAAIIVGGAVGIIVSRIGSGTGSRAGVIDAVIKMLGLTVAVLGLQMALLESHDYLPVVICLTLGTLIGELAGIEKYIEKFGKFLQGVTRSKSDTFVTGFVTASIMFCIGATAILGAIRDGLINDPTLLYVKSLMDGVMAAVFASSMGIGVLFSALSIFVYQGLISLGSSQLSFMRDNPVFVAGISVTGGIIVMGIGLNLLGLTKLRIGNTLPAIFLIPVYDAIMLWL